MPQNASKRPCVWFCILLVVSSCGLVTAEDPVQVCEKVRNLAPGEDRCAYVREYCESDSMVNYTESYYCDVSPVAWKQGLMIAGCVGLLITLFRIMALAADEFFSVILSQISQDLGLPPRLAGVTLLALGNGAPDLSAIFASVKAGNTELALGALTGASMFVTCVVAGRVIRICGGVSARGAQLRDISFFAAALVLIAIVVGAERVNGGAVAVLLLLYTSYVAAVAVADISKRTGLHWTSWRLVSKVGDAVPEEGLKQGLLAEEGQAGDGSQATLPIPLPPAPSLPYSAGSTGRAPSDGSSVELMPTQIPRLPDGTAAPRTAPPVAAFEVRGRYRDLLEMSVPEYRRRALAEVAESTSFAARGAGGRHLLRARPRRVDSSPSLGPAAAGAPSEVSPTASGASTPRMFELRGEGGGPRTPFPGVPSATELDALVPHAFSPSLNKLSWGGGGSAGALGPRRGPDGPDGPDDYEEGRGAAPPPAPGAGGSDAARATLRAWALALPAARWACWAVELPFVLALRASVPLVERDAYRRPWFVLSCALCPLAVCTSLQRFATADLATAGGVGGALGAAAAVLTHPGVLPAPPPEWSLGTSYPLGALCLALGGFAVAALWINAVATELVGLLQFFGVLSGIPAAVLGVTVLAWGNSLTDFVTNASLARRGAQGTSMAMTACFAGPMFNALMGLGAGFAAALQEGGGAALSVRLPPVATLGIACAVTSALGMILTSMLHHKRLPAWAGLALMAWYAAYLAAVLAVVLTQHV